MSSTLQSPNSDTITRGVRVRACAQYVPEQSDPDRCSFVYVYRITISNDGENPVTLRRRHWIILDSHGERDDVRGAGVVGETPTIQPGGSYEYVSRCPLSTRWGTMEGSYAFTDVSGEEFDVEIGRFFLVPSSATSAEV